MIRILLCFVEIWYQSFYQCPSGLIQWRRGDAPHASRAIIRDMAGFIVGVGSANGRRRYIVTSSFIG